MYFDIGRSVALQRRQKMAQPSEAPIFVFQITLCFSQTRSEGRFTGYLICSIIESQFRYILRNQLFRIEFSVISRNAGSNGTDNVSSNQSWFLGRSGCRLPQFNKSEKILSLPFRRSPSY